MALKSQVIFKRRNAEKLLSAVGEVAGTTSSNFMSRHILDQEVAVPHPYSSAHSLKWVTVSLYLAIVFFLDRRPNLQISVLQSAVELLAYHCIVVIKRSSMVPPSRAQPFVKVGGTYPMVLAPLEKPFPWYWSLVPVTCYLF